MNYTQTKDLCVSRFIDFQRERLTVFLFRVRFLSQKQT